MTTIVLATILAVGATLAPEVIRRWMAAVGHMERLRRQRSAERPHRRR